MTFRTNDVLTAQRGTDLIAPADFPALLVVMEGSCTVGDERHPLNAGQALMVEVGDTVNLKVTTEHLEIFRVEFIDHP